MRALRAAIAAAAATSVVCPPSAAWAQAAGQAQPDYEAAKRHYGAAEAAAAEGNWSVAIAEYGKAYEITKDPVLFFKLGDAHQRAGQCGEAVGYYRRYLSEGKPSEQFRADTEARIARCEADAAASAGAAAGAAASSSAGQPAAEPSGASETAEPAEPAEASQPAEPSPPTAGADDAPLAPPGPVGAPLDLEREQPTWQETAAWASVGIAIAATTAGAVFGLSSSSREEDIENLLSYRDSSGRPTAFEGSTRARYEDLLDEGERFETLSWVSFGVAGAAVASAVLFFALDHDPADELGGAAIAPSVSAGGAGVSAGWRF